jgi:hypothetical protein
MPAAAEGWACAAVLDRFCKKSKPGTNWPKPKADVSLMVSPEEGRVQAYLMQLSAPIGALTRATRHHWALAADGSSAPLF